MSRVLALSALVAVVSAGCLPPPVSHGVTFPPIPSVGCPSKALACTTPSGDNSTSYDGCCVPTQGLFVYAQNWTMGYCQNPNNTCAETTLRALPKKQFTLHGLWADRCDGSYETSPFGCDRARNNDNAKSTVDHLAPKSLREEMEKVWMGADGDYNWMWSHEWNKHGTCVSTLKPECFVKPSPGQDELAYFRAALNLRPRFNLYKIFAAHGIVPSTTHAYNRTQFQAALKAETGFEGAIQCAKNANGTSFLSEVWTYLIARPGFKFDNHEPVLPYNSCNIANPIYYLPQKY
ncbi:ribonuclease T2-like [Geranomyces michiganensis]|nr:ribonuclease T2-like [Geranomyces michiganensis]